MGNKVCLRDLGPGVGFWGNFTFPGISGLQEERLQEGTQWCWGQNGLPGVWELLGRKTYSGGPGVEVFRNLEVLKLRSRS